MCHCSSQPSFDENGQHWSVTSAREAILLKEMLRVERLQIRGHSRIVQRQQFTAMPDRCVATNCCNVVDLSKYIFVLNIPFFGYYCPHSLAQRPKPEEAP